MATDTFLTEEEVQALTERKVRRALLAHADSRTTDRIYRRKPEVVKPMK